MRLILFAFAVVSLLGDELRGHPVGRANNTHAGLVLLRKLYRKPKISKLAAPIGLTKHVVTLMREIYQQIFVLEETGRGRERGV